MEHSLYKHQSDLSQADAIAWGFTDKDTFVQFPFNFPLLEPNELRANVLYSGLCLSDSNIGRAAWGSVNYPIVPGHEIIAEVSQVGSEVTKFKVGDKVAFGTMREICNNCKYCQTNRGEPLCEGSPNKFTYGRYFGGYATQIQQPADFFVTLPEGLNLEKASPLLCAGITVYSPIKKYLRKNDVCAVFGVGGLGHLAVQFINKMGNEVYGVTTSPDKREFIKSIGATDIIDSSDESQILSSESRFDFIIDTIPSTVNFDKRFNLLAADGTYVIVGVGALSDTNINLSIFKFVMGERKLVGSLVGSRETISDMLEFCAKNDVYPMVETFSFDEFPKALDRLENGKPIFRCVVKTEEYSKKMNFFK